MSDVLFRRLRYFLTPQYDIYMHAAELIGSQEKVLDIGFGTGFGALYIADKTGASMTGIDIDRNAVKFANECLPGPRWEWGDISRSVGYIGKNFDTALMIEVLEHVEDWQLALKNAGAVLKNCGRIIISARNTNANLRKNDLHEREWSANEFVNALKKYFERVQLYDYMLKEPQDIRTTQTPLVAIAWKGKDA